MERDEVQSGPTKTAKPCGCGERGSHPFTPHCSTRCDELPRELIHYYNGRFLAARDFRDERDYVLGRHRMANQLFHGFGTICGLQVEKHPRPDCVDRWIVVTPGLALDCCGREILVCDRSAIELPEPVPADDQDSDNEKEKEKEKEKPELEVAGQIAAAPDPARPAPPAKWGPYLVCLRYAVRPIEPGPVLLDGCEPGAEAYNRLREEHVLEIVKFDPKEHAGCWPWPPQAVTGGGECPPCDYKPEQIDCFAPNCPCSDCVPLALLYYDRKRGLVIDTDHQPRVRNTHASLTRVAHINWPHGGRLTRRQLQHDLNGRLEVCFTRPLKTANLRPGTGINKGTFEVVYTESQGDYECVPSEDDREPHVDKDGCKAIFEIDSMRMRKFSECTIRIKLHCNCILDVHGNPIDGDFLNGVLPSGDGVAGGAFESWFFVGDDEDEKEAL